MKLATFDIFDTTLIRKCGKPELVFELLANKLYPDNTAAREAFYNWRINSKSETIYESYRDTEIDFPEYSKQQLIAAELDIEKSQLTVNPAVKDIIQRYRREGWNIAFISDMYLPSSFLAEKLKEEGCLEPEDKVYVSCECGARKDTGSLYDYVRQYTQPNKWHHYGDNLRSDVKMARKKGIKAHKIDTSYTDVERRLISKSSDLKNGWQLAILVGLSRMARLKMGNTPEAKLAADYVVPTYIPYVIYVIKEAKRQGIERLQFLSRDGYIMLKMAEALDIKGIDYNYLFVSRRSLMASYLESCDIDDYLAIVDRHTLIKRDVDHMLWQLQTDRKTLKKDYGIEFPYKKILSKAQEKDFLDKIFNHPQFTKDFKSRCTDNREILIGYLKQEGVTDYRNAFVDVGWLGTSRLMLSNILDDNTTPTFYMGIRRDVYGRRSGNYIPYYRSGKLDTNATALIEAYLSASPWPTTIGYTKETDGRYSPLFPTGEKYSENEIIKNNAEASTIIGKEIANLDFFSNDILYIWSYTSISSLSIMLDNDVDLTPIVSLNNYEGGNIIKRLNMLECFKLLFAGKSVTACDKGSLKYTFGKMSISKLWKLHTLTSRIRGYIYNKMLK